MPCRVLLQLSWHFRSLLGFAILFQARLTVADGLVLRDPILRESSLAEFTSHTSIRIRRIEIHRGILHPIVALLDAKTSCVPVDPGRFPGARGNMSVKVTSSNPRLALFTRNQNERVSLETSFLMYAQRCCEESAVASEASNRFRRSSQRPRGITRRQDFHWSKATNHQPRSVMTNRQDESPPLSIFRIPEKLCSV